MTEAAAAPRNDWLQKASIPLAAGVCLAALGGVFGMWNSVTKIEAQAPVLDRLEQREEQFRSYEIEQIRLGLQVFGNKLDVLEQEQEDLDDRVRVLELRQ